MEDFINTIYPEVYLTNLTGTKSKDWDILDFIINNMDIGTFCEIFL